MPLLTGIIVYLFLGARSHASLIIFISLLIGICFPGVASSTRELLPIFLVIVLGLGFVRDDGAAWQFIVQRINLSFLLSTWLLVVSPILAILFLELVTVSQEFSLALFLFAAVSPMTSTPAVAVAFGVEPKFAVVGLFLASFFMPVTLPVLGHLFFPSQLGIDFAQLAARTAMIILSAYLLARLFRYTVTLDKALQVSPALEGVSVIMVGLICLSVMDGVGAAILGSPMLVLEAFFLTLILGIGLAAVGYILFRTTSVSIGLAACFTSGLRNVGIALAAIGDAAELELVLVVASAQWLILGMSFIRRVLLPVQSPDTE